MSAVTNLEALINLENTLKSEYEEKLKAGTDKVSQYAKTQVALQSTIEKQEAQIAELMSAPKETAEAKRLKQEHRELSNRAGNLQKEIETQRAKNKAVRKELIEAKTILKDLSQLDAKKLKKNLVSTKTKLAEERKANKLLTKKMFDTKKENDELLHSNEILKKELESLKEEELAPEDQAAEESTVENTAESTVESTVESTAESETTSENKVETALEAETMVE